MNDTEKFTGADLVIRKKRESGQGWELEDELLFTTKILS